MFTDNSTAEVDGDPSDSTSFLQAQIVGETYVRIIRDKQNISWNHKVHAINWFNARFLILYNFYNFLAARSVELVGGVPLFKGRLIVRVLGEEPDQRGILLIVQYPSPRHFRKMLENTYFKLVSILRAIAVQRFTFCLTHTVSDPHIPLIIGSATRYGIHHFRGDGHSMAQLLRNLSDANMAVVFSSLKTHELVTVNSTGNSTPVPVLMDGIILFECPNETRLRAVVNSTVYQNNINNCSSSFVGLFERIL